MTRAGLQGAVLNAVQENWIGNFVLRKSGYYSKTT